jgi:hypothetical protein
MAHISALPSYSKNVVTFFAQAGCQCSANQPGSAYNHHSHLGVIR